MLEGELLLEGNDAKHLLQWEREAHLVERRLDSFYGVVVRIHSAQAVLAVPSKQKSFVCEDVENGVGGINGVNRFVVL